ncbi:MAG: hypothetical protein WC911_03650 [Thermoleophilia bacterium]
MSTFSNRKETKLSARAMKEAAEEMRNMAGQLIADFSTIVLPQDWREDPELAQAVMEFFGIANLEDSMTDNGDGTFTHVFTPR